MVTVQNEKSFSVRSDKYHRGVQETVTLSYIQRGNQLKRLRPVLNIVDRFAQMQEVKL